MLIPSLLPSLSSFLLFISFSILLSISTPSLLHISFSFATPSIEPKAGARQVAVPLSYIPTLFLFRQGLIELPRLALNLLYGPGKP